ncbi:hypothetical protein SAMN05444679_11776 [Variovorax sp. CF079]|nr:hypothetical protein SAMN05444679_11776 [Variovorax sp. CF079]
MREPVPDPARPGSKAQRRQPFQQLRDAGLRRRLLNLSPHTVKRHLARILERLELASPGEAADWYRKRQGSQHRN